MEGVVEVRDPDQRCWHTARITDVSKDKVQVAFEIQGKAAAKSLVDWDCVREAPQRTTFELKEVRPSPRPRSPAVGPPRRVRRQPAFPLAPGVAQALTPGP